MAKNLMESLAEDEKALAANPETETELLTDEGEEDGNESVSTARDKPEAKRGSSAGSESDETEGGDAKGRGERGRPGGVKRGAGRPSGGTPQGEGGASHEDGETPSRDSSGTRKDGGASHEDASGTGVTEDEPPAPGDHAAWAKLRREKRELEAQLRATKAQPAPAAPATITTTPKAETKPAAEAEPDRATNPEAWKDWKIGQLEAKQAEINSRFEAQDRQQRETKIYTEAIGEFNQIRDKYIAKNPDYVPAFHHSFDAYAKSIKMMRPDLSPQQITGMIDREMLQFAGQCVSKGLNPAEELYDLAMERFGYVPNSVKGIADEDSGTEEEVAPTHKAPDGIKPKDAPRPNLRKIADNRKRSASPLVGAGQAGRGQLTKEAAANMTMGEMMDLDPSDWAELERHGGS
jgi:hypothetical protein